MNHAEHRAARVLLGITVRTAAGEAGVSATTIKRMESGRPVSASTMRAVRSAMGRLGAVSVPAGSRIDGEVVAGGVVLRRMEGLGP